MLDWLNQFATLKKFVQFLRGVFAARHVTELVFFVSSSTFCSFLLGLKKLGHWRSFLHMFVTLVPAYLGPSDCICIENIKINESCFWDPG